MKTFTCKGYSKTFFRQYSLKRRSITCKNGKVTYSSPCKKSFKTSWHLNQHNAQVHTSQKTWLLNPQQKVYCFLVLPFFKIFHN